MSTDSYAGLPVAHRGGKHEPDFNYRLFFSALVGPLGAILCYPQHFAIYVRFSSSGINELRGYVTYLVGAMSAHVSCSSATCVQL